MRPASRSSSLRLALCLPLLSLAGCGVFEQAAEFTRRANHTQAELRGSHDAFARSLSDRDARYAAQEVDRPWLAGRAQPLAREVTLPAALRADVQTAMMFPDNRVDVVGLGERITQATGIPVRVRADALLPVQRFMPRIAGADGLSAPAVPATLKLPVGAQPLPRLLDIAAARLGISWRYHDDAIELYRTETRVFNVRALLAKSSSVSSLGRSPDGNAAFTSASGTRIESSVADVLASITTRLEPFMTLAGSVAAHADGSSLVVVSDIPDALNRIGRFLDRENRALTRRVRIVFEEVTVAMREGAEAGLDWDLIYTAARAAAAATAPGALGSPVSGALSATASTGRWAGSSAIIRALNEVGVVLRHTSVPMVTLNRRPVTHAVRTTFSWIDQVQTTAMPALGNGGVNAALPSVSVSQKEETVGQFLTLVPDAQENGQVLLAVSYDNTVAQPLTSVTFGEGGSSVQIQQLTIEGSGSVQQVELRPGQPMIVSGFDRQDVQTDSRRLGAQAPMVLGGSERTSHQRTTTLVILTAQVEEGY